MNARPAVRTVWLIVAAVAIAGLVQTMAPAPMAASAPTNPALALATPSAADSELAIQELAGATGESGADLGSVARITNRTPLPPCRMADDPTLLAAPTDWRLTLLDTQLAVPPDYVPPDLTSLYSLGFPSFYQVRAVMGPDLMAMTEAATRAGVALGAVSAYRDYQTQAYVLAQWIHTLGEQQALLTSARPGHSEHQLGLAIDFADPTGDDPWSYPDWAQTPAGEWLAQHAWRFGFVMSYPQGKESVTCYGYEPWHYRYVGRAEAAAIHDSGLTLREWLWRRQPDPSGASDPPIRGVGAR